MLRHIKTLAIALLALSLPGAVEPARAAFPEQPVTLIVPWAAGE